TQFETVVSLGAGLCHRLLLQDHAVGLHIPGQALLRPGNGKGSWTSIMHALARCSRQAENPADWLATLLSPMRDGMAGVLVTARDPESLPRVAGLTVMALGDA